MNFNNRVVLISGSINSATRSNVNFLNDLGATVVVVDSGQGDEQLLAWEWLRKSGACQFVTGNARESSTADALIKEVVDQCGRLDVLINGACEPNAGAASHADDDVMLDTAMAQLRETVLLSRSAMRYMAKQNYGRIVNTSSGSGIFGSEHESIFSAAAGAVIGFTKSLSHEAKGIDVKVNAVAPLRATAQAVDLSPDQISREETTYDARHTSPIMAYLSHESCSLNGELISAGGGRFARIFSSTISGYFNQDAAVSDISDNLRKIMATNHAVIPLRARDEILMVEL